MHASALHRFHKMTFLSEIEPQMIAGRFKALQTREDVACLLEIKIRTLNYLLYALPLEKRYKEFRLRKRTGGDRRILVPSLPLKYLQKKLNDVLKSVYSPRACAHAFLPRKNIVSNAAAHVGRLYVLNVDLQDFFVSINFGRVRGLFCAKPYCLGQEAATVLAQICCYDNQLPQGAPSSPIVSNMICSRLDSGLIRLSRNFGCFCSRYADDITISKSSGSFPKELGSVNDDGSVSLGDELAALIRENGFLVNHKKVHLQNNQRRQQVTGLVVNKKLNVPRTFVRQIRATVHAWRKFGYDAANEEHATRYYRRPLLGDKKPELAFILRGKLDYLTMVKGCTDHSLLNLQRQLSRLDESYLDLMKRRNERQAMRDVFISYASEDKNIAQPLADELIRRGFSVWYAEYELAWGDHLRERIDEGLAKTEFGILILSPSFFAKRWPLEELNGLFSKQTAGVGTILPIMHMLDEKGIVKYSPMLGGRLALKTSEHSVTEIVDAFEQMKAKTAKRRAAEEDRGSRC